LVFRNEPWLLDCEYALSIIGGNARHLKRFKGTIERSLRSDYCKQIICWHEAAKKTLLHNLDCRGFRNKITTLPLATVPRNFVKTFDDKRIKLLFVNSSNISGQFELKGGREIMEIFAILSKMFNNLEMVIRSDIPENIKGKYNDMQGLRIIEKVIPWQELEQEFKTADIFLMPTHVTPYQAFLDAMSYELPIITIDAWANPEIVEDGKTGFVCRRSERVEYYTDTYLPTWDTPKFLKGIQKTDPKVVSEIARKMSYLIENVELRRNMGKLGRWEVENGKFSIFQRNKKLKMIFDEATS
jgi:glycosyltransferase involved in cell wall biosynthesis